MDIVQINEVLNKNPNDFISDKHKAKAIADSESIEVSELQTKIVYEGIKNNGEKIIIERAVKQFKSDNTFNIIQSYLDVN